MRSFFAAAVATALALTSSRALADTKRFALGVFHFNLQYVAGGLIGMGGPDSDKSEKDLEDRIIVETFEPVLDLFLAHPTWGQDIELQGYMLEVLAQRHPGVLDKLRTLATKKQIDVISFHYSDQLYIAYPRADWEHSLAMTKTIFEGAAVPLSTSVFCQEGQIGLGIAAALPDVGRKTLIWSRQNFAWQHPNQKPAPLYTVGNARIVVTEPQVTTAQNGDTIESNWTFVDDGELLAAGGTSPYFNFSKQPQAIADYEKKLADLETQGFAITPTARYVEALEAAGIGEPAPPLLDGTWQPQVTNSAFKWMGGRALFGNDERDNEVRTLAAIAHRELMLAEAAARAANVDARAELDAGWRLLALGEVSDATGITPIKNEVEYGLAHLSEALRLARDVIARAKSQSGASGNVVIDAAAQTMSASSGAASATGTESDGPLAVQVTAPDRDVRVHWEKLEGAHWIAHVDIAPGDASRVSITFPGAMGDIVYTPALSSSVAHAPRSAFGFEQFNLPLWDGLVGLGNGRFLIKDTAFVHLAARVTPQSGDVSFTDETVPLEDAVSWKIHVLDGDEASAAKLAQDLNVAPRAVR